jgi:hypothetical protein
VANHEIKALNEADANAKGKRNSTDSGEIGMVSKSLRIFMIKVWNNGDESPELSRAVAHQ